MLVLPWFVRLGIDVVIISTPFLYLNYHPTTHLFEYFQNRRRIKRRLSQKQLGSTINQDGLLSVVSSKKLYEELGIQY